jgi:membrane protein implicated in regulation of membrane protease activity
VGPAGGFGWLGGAGLVIPGMSAQTLGIVLIAVAIVWGGTLSLLSRKKPDSERGQRGRGDAGAGRRGGRRLAVPDPGPGRGCRGNQETG